MALAPGRACNLLVDDGELPESTACELVGAALAGVHASPVDDDDDLPAIEGDGWIERYARCAAPLDAYVGAGRPWDPAEPTGFVRWALVDGGRLERCRQALRDASAKLPSGVLHGDPYPDNLLHSMATGISTFVDWEDVGRGPLVFDVASAAVGACFLHDSVVDSVRLASSTPQRAALKVECLPVWKSKFYGAFVLDRRVVLHAIDATPARWRGDAGSSPLDRSSTAASSRRNDLVKNCRVHPTHWLISTQRVTTPPPVATTSRT